ILRKMKDPRIGFVSVTDVEMSRDLRHAKIYVSIFGDDEAKAQTLEALHHAQGFVRSELGRRIRLRHTPEISFRLDDSIERGHRINRLLRELAPEPQAAQSSDGREARALARHDSFVITCHVDPDPDCLGSMLALAWGLRRLGKEVAMVSDDPVGEELAFLPGVEEVRRQPAPAADALVIVDCDSTRIGA